MIRILALLCLGLFAACGSRPPRVLDQSGAALPAGGENASAFVLPGAYAEQTSLVDFQALFGKANVSIVPDPERSAWGPPASRVILFPDDPTRRAFVDFHDADSLIGVSAITVRDSGSVWRGKLGVRIGMSLAELRAVNGKTFYYAGFDSLGRGWCHDSWSPALDGDDGSLGKLDVHEGDQMYFGVELGLRPSNGPLRPSEYPENEYSVMTDDPRFPQIGSQVVVTAINATTSLDDEW